MKLQTLLFELSRSDALGNVADAAELAAGVLAESVPVERGTGLTRWGVLKGESDYTVLIDAHIDQVGMVVTAVDDEGFLTVAGAGGLDLRALPARPVTVHGKQKLPAVFCSTPPHLSGEEKEYGNIADIKLDTGLGAGAKEIVSPGDMVTFTAEPAVLAGGRVTGRSFDDRAGVACVLELARRLKMAGTLPVTVCFLLSDGEELGLRGVRPAAYTLAPQEAVAIDVTFGDGPGIAPEESGRLGKGPMIGFSPSLDHALSKKLTATAEQNHIPYQIEVMGNTTGTNADQLGVTRGGVKTATISIPLRNMHTEAEVVDMVDLEHTCDLLEAYILAGGGLHA